MNEELAEPQLLICHTCEARYPRMVVRGKGAQKRTRMEPGRYRAVVRTTGEHARFMDQHRDCARDGWGTSSDLR